MGLGAVGLGKELIFHVHGTVKSGVVRYGLVVKEKTKMKQKLLRIDEVKIDDRVYPRASIDSYVIAKYVKAMKSGSVFPPIIVAKYEGKYLLVDGAHRLTTNKQLKNTHIEAIT